MLRNIYTVFRDFNTKFSTDAHHFTKVLTESLPTQEPDTNLLKVAIIGAPNAGKSTFINNVMDRKVCPTSSKVHTTRARSMAIFTESNTQIVFLDTPGLVNQSERKKFNLERSFAKDSKSSLLQADCVGIIHDVSNIWTRDRLDIKVICLLEEFHKKPSFLILNKIDLLKSKRKLLDITRMLTENCLEGKPIPSGKPLRSEDKDNRGWPNFQEIFMVSSIMGNGLDAVRNYLIKKAKPSPWMFPAEVWSDQTTENIIVNSVKAKLLDFLPQEIPYRLRPEIELLDVNYKGVITTVVLIHCPTEKLAKLVAGTSNGKLRQINESVQHDLQNTFQNYVRIKLVLEVPTTAK